MYLSSYTKFTDYNRDHLSLFIVIFFQSLRLCVLIAVWTFSWKDCFYEKIVFIYVMWNIFRKIKDVCLWVVWALWRVEWSILWRCTMLFESFPDNHHWFFFSTPLIRKIGKSQILRWGDSVSRVSPGQTAKWFIIQDKPVLTRKMWTNWFWKCYLLWEMLIKNSNCFPLDLW